MKHTTRTIAVVMALIFILGACAHNRDASEQDESGMFNRKLKIRSLPTKAKIFINEQEIGTTPLTYTLRHEEKRMVNIKAVPIYPNQYTQNIFIMIPPIPNTMTIYMNHYPEVYDLEKDKPFLPPEKAKPEIVVETRTDTVYVKDYIQERIAFTAPRIFFDTDLYTIKPSEEDKLQEFIDNLKLYQDFMVDIYGFADFRGTDQYNITLSLNRAKAVFEYLVQNGIDPNRLAAYGHGKIARFDTKGIRLDLAENRQVIFLLRR